MSKIKKLMIEVVLLLFMVAVLLIFWLRIPKKQNFFQETNVSMVKPIFKDTKSFFGNQSPEYFPVDLVPSAQETIIKNEERQGGSQLSYILVYESQKTLAENKAYFQNFWDKNKWQAGQGLEEDGRSVLAASKGSNSLTVSLYQAKAGDPVIVNLIYLQAK